MRSYWAFGGNRVHKDFVIPSYWPKFEVFQVDFGELTRISVVLQFQAIDKKSDFLLNGSCHDQLLGQNFV